MPSSLPYPSSFLAPPILLFIPSSSTLLSVKFTSVALVEKIFWFVYSLDANPLSQIFLIETHRLQRISRFSFSFWKWVEDNHGVNYVSLILLSFTTFLLCAHLRWALLLFLLLLLLLYYYIRKRFYCVSFTESRLNWKTSTNPNSAQLPFLYVITQTLETVNLALELGYLF